MHSEARDRPTAGALKEYPFLKKYDRQQDDMDL